MTSPIETIADALIAFILSLLHDPEAAEEFAAAPEPMLARQGLGGVCMADVAAVRPVIVDHPRVIHQHHYDRPDTNDTGPVGEIVRMVQHYTATFEQHTAIDARSTLVDQSVNQNIWTEGGDVTQLFDQEAVIASGDQAVAAGNDVNAVDSDVDVTIGDVSIGNEENTGSFNQVGGAPDDSGSAEGGLVADPNTGAGSAPVVDDAVAAASASAVSAAPVEASAPPVPADVPEPADVLESDMTAGVGDVYEADAATAALDDAPADLPVDDD